MRYLSLLLLSIFLLFGPLVPTAKAAEHAKRSSLSSVRKAKRLRLKAPVYNGRRNHAYRVKHNKIQ